MVFSINKLFHLFTYTARIEASELIGGLQKYHEAGTLWSKLSWSLLASLCPDLRCVTSSQPDKQIVTAVEQGGGEHTGYSLLPVLLAGEFGRSWSVLSLWVHLRMCLFSPYYTGCLQPLCVVFLQLHLHLNLMGSLPWVGDVSCPTPHNHQCVCACTHTRARSCFFE